MSFISPKNLQYIVSLSILSRILVLVIQLVSNIIVQDHNADAYRNKYHKVLTYNSSQYFISDTHRYFYQSIEGLTKWDAQYILEISRDGYVSEQHLAFLPLLPILINAVKQAVFEHKSFSWDYLQVADAGSEAVTTSSLEDYIKSSLVGCALNNFIFFPLAAISLFGLTKLVQKKDEKYAKDVVWWFCFNPASIFFSACYTESLFAALTFTSLYLIEYKAITYLRNNEDQDPKKDNFKPLVHFNRLLSIYSASLALLALGSATRSNGLFTTAFLPYQFLLKYVPMYRFKRSNWTIMIYIAVALECIQDLLVLFMSSVIAISGYVTFQIYSYIKFCTQNFGSAKGKLMPEWCDYLIPHAYPNIQKKYWNVGFIRYYEMHQVPNFLLAMPITYLVLVGSLKKSKDLNTSKSQLVYYLQGIILTIVCGLNIHVQVTTRLLTASCPVIYWICADFAQTSRLKKKLLMIYFLSYFIVGTVLHSNFFPWT